MEKFRIISSIPDEKCCAYRAQVRCKFIFCTYWMNISDWRWSISDCEKDIKFYKGEISNVVKEIS
jgi:hypothetical protein